MEVIAIQRDKKNMSILKILLITLITIMLISHLIIGSLIFLNWFDYAENASKDILIKLDEDISKGLEDYIENNWLNIDKKLNTYLSDTIANKNRIALVIDKDTGELVGNSLKMDNYLIFQDGSKRKIHISNMGYPALSKAYESYLKTNNSLYKLRNIQSRFYINISEYDIGEFNWLIITALPDTQLTKSIIDNIIHTVIVTIIGLSVALIAYFYLIKKLFKPARTLLSTIESFTKGDLSKRTVIVRNDEIGIATKAFNNMADTIYELVNNLENKVRERTLELEVANEIVKDNRNHLRLILDSTAEGIYGMDTMGNCTFCNRSGIEILGYSSQEELMGKNMHYQIHHSRIDGREMPIDECRIIKAIESRATVHVDDEVFWRKDGTYFHVEYRVYPQIDDEKVLGAVVTFTDITETRKVREQIDYLSFHDPVTGLYNRQFFENEIKRFDKSSNLPISIIYGDVNGLKLINDILGHEKGDELLRKTADVLKRVCRDDDIVARLGGDEFIIMLKNTESKDANKIVERIKSEIANENISGIKGSISLGTETKTSSDQNIREILNNAEEKMYSVKTLEGKSVHSEMLDDIMEFVFRRSPREKVHAQNVSRISGQIAANMNLAETAIRKIRDVGYYHDIGKIILDKSILNKTNELSPGEKEIMERHTMVGYRILNLFNETMDIAEVVLAHHERWDGKGYPKCLKGEEIPLYSRIISVAEGYDAMTNRVDGSNLSPEEAMEDIRSKSGSNYDPEVVKAFLNIK